MPTHPQQPRNPWEQDSPTNADYMQMIRELNTRDGQNPKEAEFNAVQEMQHYMKNDINPMGPISGREATYNESQGKRLEQESEAWQKQQVPYNMYATTRADGLSFGDYMQQQYSTQQAQRAQQQEQQLAKDKAMGRMYGESILGGNGMHELRNMRLADNVPGFQPPTIKLQGK